MTLRVIFEFGSAATVQIMVGPELVTIQVVKDGIGLAGASDSFLAEKIFQKPTPDGRNGEHGE